MKRFDVIVLGSGPGGYVAAIRAAQKGKLVALIESQDIGGTCLNRGCIPTKTLLAHAQKWDDIKKASEFGINIEKASFSYEFMLKKKNKLIESMRNSLTSLIKANKIQIFKGFGKFQSSHEVKVLNEESEVIFGHSIIIATGSEPKEFPSLKSNGVNIFNSTSLLEQTQLPSSLLIIGGGVIGCEFASLYSQLGVKVTIVEALDKIIAQEGNRASDFLKNAFSSQGIEIITKTTVLQMSSSKNCVTTQLSNGQQIVTDWALISTGRTPNSTNLNLEAAGLTTNKQGYIHVNDHMQTAIPHIYAIGDITGKWLLAHVASHQGIVAADHLNGLKSRMHYEVIPSVTYTHPEIASVGYNLEKALELGFDAQLASFPFSALGKSQATDETKGFAHIVIEKQTQKILGGQVVGHEAGNLISELALAMQNELNLKSIEETVHPHPTLSEVWLETALIGLGTPLHLPPLKKKDL